MQANYVQRLRLVFSKQGPARYIGHLDLARSLERSLNRAEIPIAYTQGFNQRPRLSFAAALPLGYTSEYELADIWLMQAVAPLEAQTMMMSRMAPGIVVSAVNEVPLKFDSLQSLTVAATYQATPLDPLDGRQLEQQVKTLLEAESLPRVRKRGKGKAKEYDLRPLITSLTVDRIDNKNPSLSMELLLLPGKSGRPDEVLAALGLDPLAAHVHRTYIQLRSDPSPENA